MSWNHGCLFSENTAEPMWRDKLEPLFGVGELSCCAGRMPVSVHEAGIEPKVAADQRRHGIGVTLEVYTEASLSRRAEAAEELENRVLRLNGV